MAFLQDIRYRYIYISTTHESTWNHLSVSVDQGDDAEMVIIESYSSRLVTARILESLTLQYPW